MNRFSGKIGFAVAEETRPGVWTEDNIVERTYYGEVLLVSRKLQVSGNVNDDINISNRISVIGDPYAYENIHMMRYVEYMYSKWKITEVDASHYPRLTLTIGGLYNG